MNQSNWFSLDEIEQQLQNSGCLESNKLKKPVTLNQVDVEEMLAQFQVEILHENVIKYHVAKIELVEESKKVNDKSRIKVLFEERDSFGIIVDKNTGNNQGTKISMASSIEMIQGLRMAILSMSEGDVAWFKICNDQLYTKTEIAAGTQVINTSKFYKITLQEVVQPTLQLDLTNLDNRLLQIEIFRKEGNEYYQKCQYESAINRYQKGLNFLEKWPRKFEDDPKAIEGKRSAFLVYSGNQAQCLIKLNRFQDAIKILEPVIGQMRNRSYEVKNYYRLINCFYQLQEYDKVTFYLQQLKHMCKLSEEEQHLFESLKI